MLDLQPHQKAALRDLSNGKILWGGVGAGKTRVALAYYLKDSAPAQIYVITTAKKRDTLDWEKEAAGFGIGKEQDATVAGVLTVDSWNNIDKYVGVKNAFFVFDEQRLVGAGKWVKAFLKIAHSNRWIMLSATPGDTWLDYIPVFIANGFYRNRTEFKREHVVYAPFSKFPKVDHYVSVGRLVKHRNNILVHMPYLKETVRHSKTIYVDYDQELMDVVMKKRWNPYKEQPIRDAAELWMVMRKVVNSHSSRLEAVRELLRRHDRLIVFYSFDYELEALRGLESLVPIAELNGHKHQELPDTPKWAYLCQYVAGSEGWNCVETDAICFYSPTYSYKNWAQAHGRIDRLNTSFVDLWYYSLRAKALVDSSIYKSLKMKKNFQPAEI